MDGKKVEYVAQLQQAIAFRHPGDVVSLDVARKGGRTATVKVPLQRVGAATAESPDSNDDAAKGDTEGSALHQLGVSVAPVDAQAARELQIPSDIHGLIVTGVKDGTSAANHLATPDNGGPDVILSVEGKPVQTPEQLRAALAGTKAGEIVSLSVYNTQAKTRRIERVRVGAAE